MTLPGLTPKNQAELVQQLLDTTDKEFTEVVKLPGIEKLHTRPGEEIAAVLANLIKSKSDIKVLKFVVGSHIELTYDGNPFGHIR